MVSLSRVRPRRKRKTRDMSKTYTEKRRCIDGSYSTYIIEEETQYEGQPLGTELTDAHVLRTVTCDHLKNADEEGIEYAPGRWAKKSLIKALHWETDSMGIRVVFRIVFARPL